MTKDQAQNPLVLIDSVQRRFLHLNAIVDLLSSVSNHALREDTLPEIGDLMASLIQAAHTELNAIHVILSPQGTSKEKPE